MAITSKRAQKLRPLFDELSGLCGEFDDCLADLEGSELKGEERDDESESLVTAFGEIKVAFETLAKAMPKDSDAQG